MHLANLIQGFCSCWTETVFGNECLLLSVRTSQVAAMNGHRQCTVHASGGSFSSTFFWSIRSSCFLQPKIFHLFFFWWQNSSCQMFRSHWFRSVGSTMPMHGTGYFSGLLGGGLKKKKKKKNFAFDSCCLSVFVSMEICVACMCKASKLPISYMLSCLLSFNYGFSQCV